MQLEPRQLSALNEMGIPVWELRSQSVAEISSIDEETAVQLDEELLQRHWFILVDQEIGNESETQLFNAMLLAIGLTQQDVVMLAAEQIPQLDQMSTEQKILISFGDVNCQLLLGDKSSLSHDRGTVFQTLHSKITTIVSFGLDVMLESPYKKALVWQDLQLAKSTYNQKL